MAHIPDFSQKRRQTIALEWTADRTSAPGTGIAAPLAEVMMHTNQYDSDISILHADDLEAERITPGEAGEPVEPRDVDDEIDEEDDDSDDDEEDEDEEDEDEESDDKDPGELIVDPSPS